MKNLLFKFYPLLIVFCSTLTFGQTNKSVDSTFSNFLYSSENNRKKLYIVTDSFIFNNENYKHIKKIKSSDIENIKFKKHQYLVKLASFETEINDSQIIYTLYYSFDEFVRKKENAIFWIGSEPIIFYLYKNRFTHSIIKIENENNGIIFQTKY